MNQQQTAREFVDGLVARLAANPALGKLPAMIIPESPDANASLEEPFSYHTKLWPNGEERLVIFLRK